MKKFFLFLAIFLPITALQGNLVEFIYPVGVLKWEQKEEMCIMHQKGSLLELWFWSPETRIATKGLLSSFTPAGLKILPNHLGFSFIDNDRIRVKMLNKRSPQTLDFYGPYDLSLIHWVDNYSLFFSAKERNHFNLFYGTRGGDLWRLTASTSSHYLYPQKISNTFFFIVENEDGNSLICSAPCPLHLAEKKEPDFHKKDEQFKVILEDTYPQTFAPFIPSESIEKLIEFPNTTSIAFLKMKDNQSGFFLEHPKSVVQTDEKVHFVYYRFFKENEKWYTKKLFSFDIPLFLLIPKRSHAPELRLYESILPLLPFHDESNKTIYFSHLTDSGALNVFQYSLESGQYIQKTFGENSCELYFPPCRYKNALYSGGLVHSTEDELFPQIYIDIDEKQHFIFLKID